MADTEINLPDGVRMTGTEQTGPVLEIANGACEARISLRGGQVLTWQPSGQRPVLWLSPGANYAPGKAIRGGIPVCWPWFGDHPEDGGKPAHGFARVRDWTLEDVRQVGDETLVRLSLPHAGDDHELWPHAPRPTLTVGAGRRLNLQLALSNTSQEPVTVTQALHTYFAVGDIGSVEISGLEGRSYYDKVTDTHGHVQAGPIQIDREVDRIYQHGEGDIRLTDGGLKRSIAVNQSGGHSIVVWNPWIEKTKRLGDMGGDDGYRGMVCIETGSVAGDAIRLGPGASHVLDTTFAVVSEPA